MVKNSRSFETFSIKHLPPLVFLGIIEQTSFLEIDIRRGGENDVIEVSKTPRLRNPPSYHHTFLFILLAREKKRETKRQSHKKKLNSVRPRSLVQLKKIIIFLINGGLETSHKRLVQSGGLYVVNRFLSRVFGEIHRSEATPWCRPFTVSPRESLGHYYYTNYPPISDLCLFNCVN